MCQSVWYFCVVVITLKPDSRKKKLVKGLPTASTHHHWPGLWDRLVFGSKQTAQVTISA